jgi:osmoprotectant transport system permease protein
VVARLAHASLRLVDTLLDALRWLGDPGNYSGSGGIVARVIEHIQISVQSVLLAFVVAAPIGVYIGHRRRFEFVAVTAGNLGRAIPSIAILSLFFFWTFAWPGTLGFWAVFFALFFLAIPPILTNTYVGVKGVDRDALEAARGMGMTEGDLLRRLEIPLAMPLVLAGTRTAAVQVVATATLGALTGWGGLGRFLIDGLAVRDQTQILGGAILVAALAVVAELSFGVLERLLAPRLSSSQRRSPFRRRTVSAGTVPSSAADS